MTNTSHRNETEDCITRSSSLVSCSPACFFPSVPGYSLVTVTGILAVAGTLANTLVCVTILRNPSLRKRKNYLILNLAFGDLVLTAFGMPIYAVYTLGEMERSCVIIISRLKGFNLNISIVVSLLTLCAISIERLVVIVWPLKYRNIITKQRLCVTIALSWIISSIYGIIIATDVHTHSNLVYKVFTLVSFTGMALCYIIIALCYVIILIKSIRMTYDRRNLAPSHQDNTDRRVALTVALIIGLFTITWIPFVFFRFFAGNHDKLWFKVSELLALSSSAFNSIIYFYRAKEYRAALKHLVRRSPEVHSVSRENYRRTVEKLELTNRPI
ncbi:alpha-1A adrenergic receptor-like [Actinia tenebrosa]|uniref:Alpha-1A adrenergic receptor-like n=1 Tax=Actinia tenebrosa TaxID=6105 RepID=A0A6P8IM69_ACTTE|nr:alpha-1A adrenergic receptor-like [Actinia tenebrosa]